MTSIYGTNSPKHNKIHQDTSLYGFLNGDIADHYTVPEERGFHMTGNIGSLFNSNPSYLKNVYEGIVLNPKNQTDSSNTLIGRVIPAKKDWKVLDQQQPTTPCLYCDEQPLSELLPYYPNTESKEHPNGIPNVLLNPNCNLKLGTDASPTVAGISLMGVNNYNLLNNPENNIGHELNPYGLATGYGLRGLGQGRYSTVPLANGLLVPNLKVERNANSGKYVANPSNQFSNIPNVPLYQTGNWPEDVQGNFIQNFNDNA